MGTTDVALWRSIHSSQFPDGPFKDDKLVPGVLYPDFEARETSPGNFRAPDVTVDPDSNYVNEGGGTSLFDVYAVFKSKKWHHFEIPNGTEFPATLKVRKTGYNKKFKANHYQIEAAHSEIHIDAFKGALDNFARAAVARKCELAH